MGFFVDNDIFKNNIIIVFEDKNLSDEYINERVELEINNKGKTSIIYIRSRHEDNVNHGPSIKIYRNTKKPENIITDIFINNDNKNKQKLSILKKYNSDIYNFIEDLIDINKDNLKILWELERDDEKYMEIVNNIILSINSILSNNNKIKIKQVIIK